MLLATVNSGTLIIALPDLERSLHTSLLTLVWVILVYMIASTVLVLSAGRLSDQFGRKNAYIGGFIVFAAGVARRGLLEQRHRADPLAGPAGHRRRVPVRQRRRDRHRRVPARAARGRDGHQHDGRGGRPGDRPGARWRAGRTSRGTGCSGSTSRSRSARQRSGRSDPARDHRALGGHHVRRAGHPHVPDRSHGARARHLQGRHRGLALAGRVRRPDRRRGASCRCSS